MKTKREEEESVEGEEHSKRQKLLNEQSSSPSPLPPRLGFDNALLPLATYDDDDEDEEEDERRVAGGGRFESGDGRIEPNGYRDGGEDDDEDEDDDGNSEQGLSQGKRNRVVELRRDCPYLDTVNRQVLYLSASQFYSSSLFCHLFGFCGRSLLGKSSNISFFSELTLVIEIDHSEYVLVLVQSRFQKYDGFRESTQKLPREVGLRY